MKSLRYSNPTFTSAKTMIKGYGIMDAKDKDLLNGGKDKYWLDEDRMVNEGMGGGQVTRDNAEIDAVTEIEKESKPRMETKQNKPHS